MFTEPLSELVNRQNWIIDIIIPVPLSEKRKRSRGYNQASRLAKPIAKSLMKPFLPEGLIKEKETKSQVGLSFEERKKNVTGAFSANSDIVNSRNILLVDDVITTGATLQACAMSLKKAGAVRVYGITIARTMNILDDFQINNFMEV
ncbi:MAG TPA: ComF family protein [Anaerolineae bacterium]|nr:ComF family protein [Anaerolineae bacterium]